MRQKKVSKKPIKNFWNVAVVIAVALAFIMPGAALIANKDKHKFTDTIISIDPSVQTVDQDETFVVSVYVEPGEPIMGVSFDLLSFNPTLIHANSVTEGDLFYPHNTFFNPGTIDNVNGKITDVYGLTIPATAVTDPGYFCNISFTAQQINGTSLLDLEDVIISNATGVEVSVTINDGLVIIGDGGANNPPYEPSSPIPSDGATGVDINADLSWTGGDPNPMDTVTYDVYFGTTSPPPQVVSGQSGTTYDPGTMSYNTQYYWQIVAWDNHGASTAGPIWDFTTEEESNNPPTSAVDPLPQWIKTIPFSVTATAFDNTGVANVTLWYRYSNNGIDWTDWTSYGVDMEEPWSWEFTGSDGYYEFYSIAVDDYGNVEDPPDAADASTGLDTVKPVTTVNLSGTMGENGWYVSIVTVTLSATDELSGVESTWYSIDSGYWKFYITPFTVSGDGEHMIEYYSFDQAGNIEDTKSVDIKIDETPPVTEHEFDGVIGEDGWFVSNVTVTLSAEDVLSGMNYTMCKLNDGNWITYVDPFVVTEDGDHTLYYYSVDLAGNIEPMIEVEFKIEHDTVPPVTMHGFEGITGDNNWFTSNVVVALSAEDDSAGVDYTMYKLEDDTEWQEYTGPILVTEDGEHTIVYYSVDRVGNEEEPCDPVEFKIDQAAPTIDLTAENTGGNNWLLTATVADETSGIAKVEFYVDGEDVGEVTEAPYEFEYTGSGSVAQAIVFDKAGNLKVSTEVESHSQSHSQSQQPIRMLFIQFLERFSERFPLLEQILLPVLSRMLNIY